jgi:hypothetical protein
MRISRLELLLLAIIWILVAVLFGLAVYVLRGTGPTPTAEGVPAAPEATPTFVPQFTPAASEATALGLYPLAQDQASQWRADAALVSCRSSWEQTALNLVGRPTTWIYRFYSAETKELYFVTVTPDGQVNGTQHLSKLPQAPPLLPLAAWQVDSQTALTNWMNAGGGQFLGDRPGIDVTAQLSVRSEDAAPAWTVVGYDRANEAYFAASVAATDGVVTIVEGD